jgi:hypothetical protein
VGPDEEREVDLTAPVGCALAGVVTGRAGEPLAGVLVNAEERMAAGSPLDPTLPVPDQARSDGSGRFRLDHVPRGTLLVRGYGPPWAVGTVTVQVGACDALAPVALVMSNGGGVAGQARGADGRPLAGAVLTVMDRSIGHVSTRSGADGRFQLGGLPAGTVRLELAEGEQRVQRLVPIEEGAVVQHDMTLFPEGLGELRGRVTAGGRPIAGARVLVASNHGPANGIAVYFPATGDDGRFRLPSIPEGVYLVSLVSAQQSSGARVVAGDAAEVELDVSRERTTPREPVRRHRRHDANQP